MKIIKTFCALLFLIPLTLNASDFQMLDPQYSFDGTNEFTLDTDDVVGVTQVLIFSGSIINEPDAPNYNPEKPVLLSGGLWKYRFTIQKPGRILQVWSRYLDRTPKSGVRMKVLVTPLEFDVALLEIPEPFTVTHSFTALRMEPTILSFEIPGTGPSLIIAAIDDLAVSPMPTYSFGELAKTHVYLTNNHNFSDPELGPITGVLGGLSFIRI
jgi:hypothetical protein